MFDLQSRFQLRRDPFEEAQVDPNLYHDRSSSARRGSVHWQGCLQEEGPQRERVEVHCSHPGMGFHPTVPSVIADRLALPEGERRLDLRSEPPRDPDREEHARPAMAHLDDVIGVLARATQWVRPRPRNTLDRLGVYEGIPLERLFPAPGPPPEVRRSLRWQLPGLVSEDLRFASQHDPLEPSFQRDYHARRRRIHTVTARRIRPASAGSRPRLLYIHGYMQPETPIEELGLLTTMAWMLDMEVVQLQPPYHGARKPRHSRFDGELYWTADLVRSIEALRQTLLDARTLLAFLHAEAPTPVGVAGLSLGGALAAALACLEPRFAFAAPFIAHMDLGELLADAPVLGAMREDLARFGWTPRDFGAFLERAAWNQLQSVIPPERIHLFASDDDRFFRPELVTQMWERWGKPPIQWYPGSHMGFIANLPDAVRRLRGFVDERVCANEPEKAR